MTKVLATIIIVLICIIMFPIGFGIIGGVFGIIFGVFGAVFGAIGGIIGGIFSAIFGVFRFAFHGLLGWDCPRFFFPHNNVFSIVVLAIIVAIIIKQRKPTPQ
jgi:hypothetical protein